MTEVEEEALVAVAVLVVEVALIEAVEVVLVIEAALVVEAVSVAEEPQEAEEVDSLTPLAKALLFLPKISPSSFDPAPLINPIDMFIFI